VKLFATGASSYHGFIAEIVTLPISAIGFSKFCTIWGTIKLDRYYCVESTLYAGSA
jgi:hypothetical protein